MKLDILKNAAITTAMVLATMWALNQFAAGKKLVKEAVSG
jgi:hypothetical protein